MKHITSLTVLIAAILAGCSTTVAPPCDPKTDQCQADNGNSGRSSGFSAAAKGMGAKPGPAAPGKPGKPSKGEGGKPGKGDGKGGKGSAK